MLVKCGKIEFVFISVVIVWGATGFTGALVAEYLAEKPATFTFGLAGRNLEKLEAVKDSLTTLNSQHKVCVVLLCESEKLTSRI